MLVIWWNSDEFDFWGFERILIVESELERVAFTCIDRAFLHSEADMPEISRLINYIQGEIRLILPNVLGLFGETDSY